MSIPHHIKGKEAISSQKLFFSSPFSPLPKLKLVNIVFSEPFLQLIGCESCHLWCQVIFQTSLSLKIVKTIQHLHYSNFTLQLLASLHNVVQVEPTERNIFNLLHPWQWHPPVGIAGSPK
jgi:hypothetical protein